MRRETISRYHAARRAKATNVFPGSGPPSTESGEAGKTLTKDLSCDITYLNTPVRGVFFYWYQVGGIWSRNIVGVHVYAA